jgi:hypothetical protein
MVIKGKTKNLEKNMPNFYFVHESKMKLPGIEPDVSCKKPASDLLNYLRVSTGCNYSKATMLNYEKLKYQIFPYIMWEALCQFKY